MAICRICKVPARADTGVRYSIRHFAHFECFLNAEKSLSDLHAWQVGRFPYRLLRERGLLAEADRLMRAA